MTPTFADEVLLIVEVPAIKKAWETMQKEGAWVLINIGYDKELETTKKRAADHQIPGIHCQFPDWEKFPEGYMGKTSRAMRLRRRCTVRSSSVDCGRRLAWPACSRDGRTTNCFNLALRAAHGKTLTPTRTLQ